MAQHLPAPVDQGDVQRAEQTWHTFVKAGKWLTLHVIVILGILLIVYLNTAGKA